MQAAGEVPSRFHAGHFLFQKKDTAAPGLPAGAEVLLDGLPEDLGLIDAHGSDALPRSAVGRAMMEAMRQVHEAVGHTAREPAVSPRFAAYGALADLWAAEEKAEGAVFEEGLLFAGKPGSVWQEEAAVHARKASELMLHAGAFGAAQCAGTGGGLPSMGLADTVCAISKNAALAAYASAYIAHGVQADGVKASLFQGEDGFFGAYEAVREVPVMEPDLIWEALSRGVRLASTLKSKGLLRACVLTLKGRGRLIGPIEGDRLLRFGVSQWR